MLTLTAAKASKRDDVKQSLTVEQGDVLFLYDRIPRTPQASVAWLGEDSDPNSELRLMHILCTCREQLSRKHPGSVMYTYTF